MTSQIPASECPAGTKQIADPDKIYELMRGELTYEANLITQRTSWFVASQAFFFTSLAAAIDRTPGVAFTLRNSLLFPMIPYVSLIVCVVIFLSVLAAMDSANNIRTQIKGMADASPLAKSFVPRGGWAVMGGLLPSYLLPTVFAVCWILILLG